MASTCQWTSPLSRFIKWWCQPLWLMMSSAMSTALKFSSFSSSSFELPNFLNMWSASKQYLLNTWIYTENVKLQIKRRSLKWPEENSRASVLKRMPGRIIFRLSRNLSTLGSHHKGIILRVFVYKGWDVYSKLLYTPLLVKCLGKGIENSYKLGF